MTCDLSHVPAGELGAVQAKREHHGQANPFFLSCTKRIDHGAANFSPVSRFCKRELDSAVERMREVLGVPEGLGEGLGGEEEVRMDLSGSGEGDGDSNVNGNGMLNGHGNGAMKVESMPTPIPIPTPVPMLMPIPMPIPISALHLPDSPREKLRLKSEKLERECQALERWLKETKAAAMGCAEPDIDIGSQVLSPVAPGCRPNPPPSVAESSPGSGAGSGSDANANTPTPTHPIQYFEENELTEEAFRPYWAQGRPVVVTGLLGKMKVRWTPEYFMEKYSNQSCLILECQTDQSQRMTVGEFFMMFGRYEGRKEHWKLKVRLIDFFSFLALVGVS